MAKRKATSEPTQGFKPELTAGDVLGLYEVRSQDGDEGRIRNIATTIRALCRLEHEVKIPNQYKATTREVRTPFMRDAWHRITSSLITKTPVIHIIPLEEKRKEYRESASIAERFDTSMIERFNKELGEDLIYSLNAQLVRDGESVLKVVHRPSAWANFPMDADIENQDLFKKRSGFPIAWRPIDRFSMVYENGEYGDEWVIEYGEYAKPYLKSRYDMYEEAGRLINPSEVLEGRPMPKGLQASATGRSVKVEFFNSREWHVIIDGSAAPGFPKPNPYAPYLPYFRASAHEKESLLYSLLYLVPRLDELLTMKLNWSYLGAYPNPIMESVPNSQAMMGLDAVGEGADAGKETFRWTPGKMMDIPLGKTFKFASPPPIGKDVNDLTILIKSLIDIAGIPSIMRGMSSSGDSGYLANQQMAAASMAYRIVAISAQRQLEKALEFTHWLVSNVIKQSVYAIGWTDINPKTSKPTKKAKQTWLSLSPNGSKANVDNAADLTKLGSVEVKYRPTLPTDDQARAMIALQLTNSSRPLYDVRHALETLLQEEDPDAIIEAMFIERALEQEPLNSMITEEALKEAGILPEPPPAATPAANLVGPDGQPLLPPGPGGLTNVTPAGQMASGTPSVGGLNRPIIPNRPGGRAAGSHPGRP